MKGMRAAGILLLCCISGAEISLARSPLIVNSTPHTIQEILDPLTPGTNQSIPDYLARAQCGGWSADPLRSVGSVPGAGLVASVTGFPGRSYAPLGNIDSGVAQPTGSFSFPATTQGIATLCDIAHAGRDPITQRPGVERSIWSNVAQRRVPTWVPYPYFEDPPCLWGPDALSPTMSAQVPPPHSPERCLAFCSWLNAYTYWDCPEENIVEIEIPVSEGSSASQPDLGGPPGDNGFPDDRGQASSIVLQNPIQIPTQPPPATGGAASSIILQNPIRNPAVLSPFAGDLLGGGSASAGSSLHTTKVRICRPDGWRTYYTCSAKRTDASPPAAAPNCTAPCIGEACRCPGPGCVSRATPEGPRPYQSFFRFYSGEYQRATVPDVPTDRGSSPVQAACYGFYREFSVDAEQTQPSDWRCAVHIESAPGLLTSQQGKGMYAPATAEEEHPSAGELRRTAAPTGNALWVPLSGAFSLLSERVLRDTYGGQLGALPFDGPGIDHAEEVTPALPPLHPPAVGNRTEEFDDTGLGAIVHWWRAQQTAMGMILRRPQLHLLLPAHGALGQGTLMKPGRQGRSGGDDASEPIRVQVATGEDAVGQILQALLPRIEEVPIPLPLYSVDRAEIQAIREAWCLRVMQRLQRPTCEGDGVPPGVQRVLNALDAYAAYMEKLPTLRTALAKRVGSILSMENALAAPVIAAIQPRLIAYLSLLTEQIRLEQVLVPRWNTVRQTYATFHDKTNLPFCMNQRFTAAVKSLLDWGGWLPGRSGANLPTLAPLVTLSRDTVLDLSHVPTLTATLKIPVLKPIVTHLDLPLPPPEREIDSVSIDLPPLPDIDALLAAMDATTVALPAIDVSSVRAPAFPLPSPLGSATIATAAERLQEINGVLTTMNAAYATYWNSILAFAARPAVPAPSCMTAMGQVPLSPLQCCSWNTVPCLAEMDLVPLIMRAASRPMVAVREDYQSHGPPSTPAPVCPDNDPTCTLFPGEILPPTLVWETTAPAQENTAAFDALRSAVDARTLPPSIGQATLPPGTDAAALLPSLNLSPAIVLPPHP